MAQWGSTDNTGSSPLYAPAQVNLTPNSTNRDLLYKNTTPDAFVNGEQIGVFGYAANEIASYPGAQHTGWNIVKIGSGGRAGRIQYETLVAGGFATDVASDFLLTFTTQPSNLTKNTHTTATLTVAGQATPTAVLAYQWQVNTGGGFANLSDGGVYSDTATAVLAISNTAALNAVSYRCLLDSSGYAEVASSNATLTVNAGLLTIGTQPAANSVTTTDPATFRVVATVAPTAITKTYQWQMWGGASFANLGANAIYTDVTTANLVITDSATLNGKVFRVLVLGVDCSTLTSGNATLTVANGAITIDTQPDANTVDTASPATFSVAASVLPAAIGLTYQWQMWGGASFANLAANAIYTDVTTDTMIITNAATLDAKIFRVTISGVDCTTAISANAVLTVNPAVITIDTQPGDNTVSTGNPATFSVAASVLPVVSMTYQWQLWGGASFANIAANSIYTGVTSDTMIISDSTGLNGKVYRVNVSAVDAVTVATANGTLTVS